MLLVVFYFIFSIFEFCNLRVVVLFLSSCRKCICQMSVVPWWLSHSGLFVSMIELHHPVMDLECSYREELVWSLRGSSRGPLEGSGCQTYNRQIGEAGVSAALENKPLDILLTEGRDSCSMRSEGELGT